MDVDIFPSLFLSEISSGYDMHQEPELMKNDSGRDSVANKPLLSIVVTSYTTERLKDIFDLLKSIQNQTYENIEVVFAAERSAELMKKVRE
jgi:hypothetical protein